MTFDRTKFIEDLANKWTDEADLDCLMDYFRDGQISYLEKLTDEELQEEFKEEEEE